MGNAKSIQHPDGKEMNAVAYKQYGTGVENLEKCKVAFPYGYDKKTNVLIKVKASSINPVDWIYMSGKMKMMAPVKFPMCICLDASGIVEEADTDGKFKVGDEVFVRLFRNSDNDEHKAILPWYRHSMAEYAVGHINDTVMKPKNMTFAEAASIPLAAMTALQALKKMDIKPDHRVFITGGAGGVGSLAIQLAKHHFKCKFVATTASAGAKYEMCKKLGADEVVDYKSEKFEEKYVTDDEKFDVIFDTTNESVNLIKIAKPNTAQVVTIAGNPPMESLLKPNDGFGKKVVLKMALGTQKNFPAFKAAQAIGVSWSHLFLQPSREDLQEIADAIEAENVKPVIDNVWKFSDDSEKEGWRGAFIQAGSGRAKGKCVVEIDGISSGEEKDVGEEVKDVGEEVKDVGEEEEEQKN